MAVVWHLRVKMTDQKQATTKNDGQRVFLLKISFNIVKFVGSIPSKDTFALTQKMVSSKQKCFMCHVFAKKQKQRNKKTNQDTKRRET